MCGKIGEFVEEAKNKLESYEGQVNGNYSNDGLIDLYRKANALENEAKAFRKKTVKSKAIERAREEGVRDEKGRLILEGEENHGLAYARGDSDIDFEEVVDSVEEQLMEVLDGSDIGLEDAVEVKELFEQFAGLLKKSGLSVTSVRDAIEEGFLPAEAMEETKPNHEKEANIFKAKEGPAEQTTKQG